MTSNRQIRRFWRNLLWKQERIECNFSFNIYTSRNFQEAEQYINNCDGDSSTATSTLNGYAITLSRIIKTHPDQEIIVLGTNSVLNDMLDPNSDKSNIEIMNGEIKRLWDQFNSEKISYLDLFGEISWDTKDYYCDSDPHPTRAGMLKITRYIETKIQID